MRHIISILIENEAGALSRVAGLFSARGYNIESLTAIRQGIVQVMMLVSPFLRDSERLHLHTLSAAYAE